MYFRSMKGSKSPQNMFYATGQRGQHKNLKSRILLQSACRFDFEFRMQVWLVTVDGTVCTKHRQKSQLAT